MRVELIRVCSPLVFETSAFFQFRQSRKTCSPVRSITPSRYRVPHSTAPRDIGASCRLRAYVVSGKNRVHIISANDAKMVPDKRIELLCLSTLASKASAYAFRQSGLNRGLIGVYMVGGRGLKPLFRVSKTRALFFELTARWSRTESNGHPRFR
jgi:hypothetical protein